MKMTSAPPEQAQITYEQFCEEWLSDITDDLPPFEKGQRFAFKLVTQWLSVSEGDDDLVLCDGSGDGGIDIAYLHRADLDDNEREEKSEEGDTWYLIQSKHGTAFQGQETIVNEGRKVIATLAGENNSLSERTNQLVGRLDTFIKQASERDRLILVFATTQPMGVEERQALNDIRILGQQRFPQIFDVEDISLQTIWEARDEPVLPSISVRIQGDFVEPSAGLKVGTIQLTNLYQFLKDYRDQKGNLDQLYGKNVRQFLGSRRKVNKGIVQTLNQEPEMFGLYNNGITIVVSDFQAKNGSLLLHDPYVVNGCQTTRTIWDVLQQKLDAGGTGESSVSAQWRSRAQRGVVVTKIVKSNSAQISDITRYTNSQNAVRDQDFIALRDDFSTWAEEMSGRYGIFLEIQRGAWESQKAYQKNHPSLPQFSENSYAYAFDLIKVYGAGWMREPGTAFGKNAPFLPGGRVFNKITTGENRIGSDDLYVAYQLHKLANQYEFGRRASRISRRQTRFFYYFVVLDLLRDTLIRANRERSMKSLTNCLQILVQEENQNALQGLLDAAIDAVDEYLSQEHEDSLFREPEFPGDPNTFLKWERLGRDPDATPRLTSLLATHKVIFGRPSGNSPRNLVIQAIVDGTS